MNWLADGATSSIDWNGISGVDLAIVNPQPYKLKGPQLLHHIPSSSNHNVTAIDFRSSDGESHQYSYADLHHLSDLFALRVKQSLAAHGRVLDQQVIPVLVSQSPELYVALLGILKAGAAFCPVDLDVPADRLKFIVNDLSAKTVVANQTDRFSWEGGPKVLLATTDSNSISSLHAQSINDCFHTSPQDLAYVMYTSGSTGTPKGVGVSHLAVTQSLLAHDRHIPTFQRFLQFAAPAFDVFVFEMFFPLFRGCTVVGCHREELLGDLPGVINRMEVDAAELTPTVVSGLLRNRTNAPRLKVLLTIGEALTRPIVDEFGSSPIRSGILHGMYGPTEAAIHCTLLTSFPTDYVPSRIGIPLDTVSALIVTPDEVKNNKDTALNILPIGHVGELAIGGHQLANGYLNNPEKTAKAFIETVEYGRLYQTGDKARLLPDGSLDFLGRISSDQVKLRGQRVELGEVEKAACSTPGIRSATSCVIDGILIVFCLVNDTFESTTSIQDVCRCCRQWLPSYMVPGDIVLLSNLPSLASGKIDKRSLERSYTSSMNNAINDESVANETMDHTNLDDTELQIRDVFSEVSRIPADRISPTATIYQLGIDSLGAVQVAASLRKKGFKLRINQVLEVTPHPK